MDTEGFAVQLRRHRLAAGMSQESLAQASGLSVRGISDLERGLKQRPHPETVRLLADALHLEPVALATFRAAATPRTPLRPVALPQALGPLVGREDDVRDVIALLMAGTRLVTLTGPGGVGKTRLALRVAAEIRGHFGDGVAFVALAGLSDHRLVLPTLATAFGIREPPHLASPEFLARQFQGRHVLAVVDNLEHLLEAALELAALLAACPGLTIAATSRAPMAITGEVVYPVRPLELPDPAHQPAARGLAEIPAVLCLIQQARTLLPRFTVTDANASAVAAICRSVDGLPLGLTLAAVRLKTLAPHELSSMLSDRLGLLTGGPRDSPDRHRTMRNTIAWSYSLLTPDDRTAFHRLSVFPTGTTIEGAAAVLAPGDLLGTSNLVASLLDQSLIQISEAVEGVPRFAMLVTIRAFALERLAASGEESLVCDRHAQYYVTLGEKARRAVDTPERTTWARNLAPEIENFRAAFAWAIAQQDAALAQRLAAALLMAYWGDWGPASERLSWAMKALALGATEAPGAYLETLFAASHLAALTGDEHRGLQYAREAVAHAASTGNPGGRARALYHLGNAHANTLDFESAGRAWAEAIVELDRLDDPLSRGMAARAACHLVRVTLDRDDLAGAESLMPDCLARTRLLGLPWETAFNASLKLADIARFRGDYDEAIAHGQEAVAVFRAHRDKRYMVDAFLSIARSLAASRSRMTLAAWLVGAAESLGDEIGLAIHHNWIDPVTNSIETALGADAFATARQYGRSLPLADAVDEALSVGDATRQAPTSA